MNAILKPLSALGRQKGRAVALLIVIAILTPALGDLLRPWIGETVFALLCLAFLRQDTNAMRQLFRHPGLVIQATLWTLIIIPLIFILVMKLTGIDDRQSDLQTILLYQAVASPMMAAPAMVALVGLDATLVLATLTVSTLLVPLTAPVLANIAGVELGIGIAGMGMRLAGIVFGSMAVGWLFRKLIGEAGIKSNGEAIDGFNIILMGVFVCAVMGGLGNQLMQQPLQVLVLSLLAFAIFAATFLLTFMMFRRKGSEQAFGLAVLSAQRNMGLMYAATGGLVVGQGWIYFSVAQFPLYLTPILLSPLVPLITRSKEVLPQ